MKTTNPSQPCRRQHHRIGHPPDMSWISWFAMVTESVLSITEGRFNHASFVFQAGIIIGQIASRLVAALLWHLGNYAKNPSRQRWRYMIRESKVIRDRCCSTAGRSIGSLRKVQGQRAGFPDQNIQHREADN
jgi:hypothetical protein